MVARGWYSGLALALLAACASPAGSGQGAVTPVDAPTPEEPGGDVAQPEDTPPVVDDAQPADALDSADAGDAAPRTPDDGPDPGPTPVDEGPDSACLDDCPWTGYTHCVPGVEGFETCEESDGDPCLDWSPITACGPTQKCYTFEDGAGVSYAQCDVGCTTDADCAEAEWGQKCKADTGMCVKCLTDDDCTSIVHWWKACSPTFECVQCIDDEDCAADPFLPGPICQGWGEWAKCVCETDADCAQNVYGLACSETGTCGCETTADCAEGTVCQLKDSGSRFCMPPCQTDEDCTWPSTPLCNPESGICGDCLHDSDCPWYHPHCHPITNLCQLCVTGEDCLDVSPYYAVCDAYTPNDSQCITCLEDADCVDNPIALGDTCIGGCTCASDADCQSTVRGKTCFLAAGPGDVSKCGCQSSAECTEAGAQCLPGLGDWVKACRVPCAGDADCAANPFAKVCDPAFQACVICLSDADCVALSPTLGFCSQHHCFECTTDADCQDNPWALGPTCVWWDTGPPTCACFDDGDCAQNPNGPICQNSLCTCTDPTQCDPGLVCAPYTLLPYGLSTCSAP